jgi:hypothetical protein
MTATLAEELLLVACIDATGRAKVGSIELGCGLAPYLS